MSFVLLSLILLPFVGAIAGALMPSHIAKWWALAVSAVVFALSLLLLGQIDLNQDLRGQSGEEQMRTSIQLHFPGKVLAAVQPQNPNARRVYEDLPTLKIPTLGFSFHLGMDTISLWLVLLTTLLAPLAI